MGIILSYLPEVFSITNLLMALGGTIVGIIIGALPGCTPSLGVALFIPVTYSLEPVSALICLGAVYVGSMYGGSITAILINIPGTAASACTTIEGYKMTQHGRSNEALAEAAIASFIGTVLSTIALLAMGPALAKVAFKFGPQEYFLLGIFGLTIIASLAGENKLKGLIGGLFGLAVSCVGMDPMMGRPRLIFGNHFLAGGVPMVPVVIGLFAFTQVIASLSKEEKLREGSTDKIGKIKVVPKDFIRYPVTYLMGSIIGIIVGIIPGSGGDISSFMSYNQSKMMYSHRITDFEKETGWREGVASSECAKNAVAGGSLIPALTLGVPGNATAAVLMSGLMVHGLTPGYGLFTNNADVTYPFMISMFVSSIMMFILGLTASRLVMGIVRVPDRILSSCIMAICIVGAMAIRGYMQDVWIMFIFGVVGHLLKKTKFGVAPIILGMILGSIAETGLSQSLTLEDTLGNVFLSMTTRPICIGLFVLIILSLAYPIITERKNKAKNASNA